LRQFYQVAHFESPRTTTRFGEARTRLRQARTGWTKPSVSHHYKGGEEGAGGSSFLRKTRKEEDVKF